jgi:HEAT repeat protein
VEPLVRALDDKDRYTRATAATALGKLRDAAAVESLIKLLEDKDWIISKCAARSLGEIGNTDAVEPLIKALGYTNEDVRAEAARALGRIKDSRAVEPLIKLLTGAQSDLRKRILSSGPEDTDLRQAAKALGEIKDARAVEPLINALGHKTSGVREAAAYALGKIKDARAVEALGKALKDDERSVFEAVVEALGEIRDPRALDTLAALPTIRFDCVERALDKINGIGPIEPIIKDLADEDQDIRAKSASLLSRFTNEKAVEALVKALVAQDSWIGGEVAGSLKSIGKFAPELVRDALEEEKDEKTKMQRWRIMHEIDE